LVTRALALGGTCTGEHGVGLHKMDFLRNEAGEGGVDAMRAIKHALDPDNIMNPGKIFTW
jgi:D-lactate dehydrogenase (cytochrome)